jgi:hypothetical protein
MLASDFSYGSQVTRLLQLTAGTEVAFLLLAGETELNSLVSCLLYITPSWSNRNTGLPTVGCHATQQYRSDERIHGSV